MSWFKRFCDDYGLSQSEVSKMADINKSTLSSMGKLKNSDSIKHTKAETIKKLADMVDASMDEIYEWYK